MLCQHCQKEQKKMKITVTTVTEYVFELDVSEDLELENFKAFCEVESGFASSEIVISFKGQALVDNKKTLKEFGIGEGDVVELQHIMQAAAAAAAGAGPQQTPNGNYSNKISLFEAISIEFLIHTILFHCTHVAHSFVRLRLQFDTDSTEHW